MPKLKITCPYCSKLLVAGERFRGRRLKCPHCRHSFRVPTVSVAPFLIPGRRRSRRKITVVAGILALAMIVILLAAVAMWFVWPAKIHWQDHRPIGELFLASDAHTSTTNPRGWFNDSSLDFTGPDSATRFRSALLEYERRSIEILKKTGAQGVIVWDLEGEQFPHKTTFIGDPRQLERLAPEMESVADEFFAKLREAGLRVGMTIRPQRLAFDESGVPHQEFVFNIKEVLRKKIDYARKRWGATLFYVDSNDGFWRPDEIWQLRSLAVEEPDILLIPEHHWLPYWGFTAPYVALRKNPSSFTSRLAAKLFPRSFQALDISDVAGRWTAISAAHLNGDVLLFRAWHDSPECRMLEKFAEERGAQATNSDGLGRPQ